MDQDAERNLGDACLKFNYSLSKMSSMGSTFFSFWKSVAVVVVVVVVVVAAVVVVDRMPLSFFILFKRLFSLSF